MPEHTFFHPDLGDWTTISDPDEATVAKYSTGTVEIPLRPSGKVWWNGSNWVAKPISLDDAKSAKTAAIAAKAASLLAAGAPVSDGRHVALDDGSRSDLTSLSSAALGAISGVISWPENYSRGWITIENTRFPLPTPADGLAFADGVGTFYSAIMQHRRDLKDAVLAAEDEAALDAIDITAGWPD